MASRERNVHHPESYDPEDDEYTPLLRGCMYIAAIVILTLLAAAAGFVWVIKEVLGA